MDGLRFGDGLSGLAKVQYSVSANKLFADAAIIPWTDIGALTPGATWYRPVITYSFPQLANAASNYFSFRAVDVAGTTRTVVDAFGIGKNVSGPVVTISTPALTFLSTFTWLSGNAYPTNDHAIRGTEVSLRDLSNGLYYNGAAFLSGSRAWQDASDTASTFTITLPGLPLVSGRQYQAVARSSDAVGDYSQVFATYTFTFDSQPPSALVLYPADGATAYSAASISGTAADPVSGITAVDVTENGGRTASPPGIRSPSRCRPAPRLTGPGTSIPTCATAWPAARPTTPLCARRTLPAPGITASSTCPAPLSPTSTTRRRRLRLHWPRPPAESAAPWPCSGGRPVTTGFPATCSRGATR